MSKVFFRKKTNADEHARVVNRISRELGNIHPYTARVRKITSKESQSHPQAKWVVIRRRKKRR